MSRAKELRWIAAVALLAVVVGCDRKKEPPAGAVPSVSAPAPESAPTVDKKAQVEEPEQEPEEIAAQHILVAYKGAERAPRGVTRTKAEAKGRAEEVLKKARAREQPFEELAMEYSDDDSKFNRASLGKFRKDKMVPEFSEAAFRLQVDEISEVVETKFGYHIIKRNQ
jgi:parvulin-like peptidyl-prolyl isomerase